MREHLSPKLTKGRSGIHNLVYPLTGQFWQILWTLEPYWRRWDIRYGGGQRPFNEWRGVQICYKQQTKRFSQVKCLREDQKDCIKIWSMKDSFAFLPTGFWKSSIFELFPWVMSLMNGEAGKVFTIMVACLALEAINERPSWTVGHNRSRSNGNGYPD